MNYFLSSREGALFGSFYYPYAIIEHSTTPEIAKQYTEHQQQANPREEPKNPESKARLVDLAYRANSFVHEARHFYDQFGTIAGITLFANFIEAVKSFHNAAVAVASKDGEWRWPLGTWANDKGSPTEIRRLVRHARSFETGARLFLGSFEPLRISGHIDEVFAEAKTLDDYIIDLAPIRMTEIVSGSKPVSTTILYPLGVEALFEANAHAFARTIVEHTFPKSVSSIFVGDVHVTKFKEGTTPDRSAQALPYMVLDRQISKFLRAKGKPTFDRATVTGVSDEVLSRAHLFIRHTSDIQTETRVTRFGDLIRSTLDGTSVDDLVNGNVPASETAKKTYQGILDTYAKEGDWETVNDDMTLMSSIRIWETYAIHHFVVPLLKLRIATDHQVFRSGEGILELLKHVPPPIVSNGTGTQINMPDRVNLAWAHVLMAGQIMQSAANSDTVLCPRAFATVPALSNMSFSGRYTCDEYMMMGCGRFDGKSVADTRCLFVHMLRGFKFAR